MKPPKLRPYDHLLLVQRHAIEVGRFRAALARADQLGGGVLDIQVEHEHDGRCCRREPWPVTLMLLLAVDPAEGGGDVRS